MAFGYIHLVMLNRTQAKRLRDAPVLDTPNKIALAMKLSGVTQMEIADATGIPQPYVSRIRNGRYSRLPGETMRTLAGYFGVHIEDLFPSREEATS